MSRRAGGGWTKGLVHLHSRFSDGIHKLGTLQDMARRRGYEFLIVTDHAEDMSQADYRKYRDQCEALSTSGPLLIPGLEIAANWRLLDPNDPSLVQDEACAHTLAIPRTPAAADELCKLLPPGLSVRRGGDAPALVWQGSTAQLRAHLQSIGCLIAAAHTFQFTSLSTRATPMSAAQRTRGAWQRLRGVHQGSDYRYDMAAITPEGGLDFFYRTVKDVDHSPEDLALHSSLSISPLAPAREAQWAHAGSDFHGGKLGLAIGPLLLTFGTGWAVNSLFHLRHPGHPLVAAILTFAGAVVGLSLGLQVADKLGKLIGGPLEWLLDHGAERLPDWATGIAHEQLTHATWVQLDPDAELTWESVCEALAAGRSCAARARTKRLRLRDVAPPPGPLHTVSGPPTLSFDAEFSPCAGRPVETLVYRDGVEVARFAKTYDNDFRTITFEWTDDQASPGETHTYILGIAGSLITAPIHIAVK